MTGASPVILSICVMASLALVLGGGRLLIRERDRTRGILMLVAAAVLLANVLIWVWPI